MFARRVNSMLFAPPFVAVGLVIALFFGQVSVLECVHPEPSQVVCEKEVRLLGLVPVGRETIRDVRGAWLDDNCDSDGCTYRVVLRTDGSDVPLTSYYAAGQRAKEEMADRINTYVEQESEGLLRLRAGSALLGGLLGGLFVAVGVGAAVASLRRR
jgi:hypothetical protein